MSFQTFQVCGPDEQSVDAVDARLNYQAERMTSVMMELYLAIDSALRWQQGQVAPILSRLRGAVTRGINGVSRQLLPVVERLDQHISAGLESAGARLAQIQAAAAADQVIFPSPVQVIDTRPPCPPDRPVPGQPGILPIYIPQPCVPGTVPLDPRTWQPARPEPGQPGILPVFPGFPPGQPAPPIDPRTGLPIVPTPGQPGILPVFPPQERRPPIDPRTGLPVVPTPGQPGILPVAPPASAWHMVIRRSSGQCYLAEIGSVRPADGETVVFWSQSRDEAQRQLNLCNLRQPPPGDGTFLLPPDVAPPESPDDT